MMNEKLRFKKFNYSQFKAVYMAETMVFSKGGDSGNSNLFVRIQTTLYSYPKEFLDLNLIMKT